MASRIPATGDLTIAGVTHWFEMLAHAGLIFHPEDDPASILEIMSGSPLFTLHEVIELRQHFTAIVEALGDESLVDGAYVPFMRAAGHTGPL